MESMCMIKGSSFAGHRWVKAGSTAMVVNEDNEIRTVTAGCGSFDLTIPPAPARTSPPEQARDPLPSHGSFHSNMHSTLRVH
jgi:hypothetical protein